MADGNDLRKLAGNAVNPYWLAFTIATGSTDNAEFICWNSQRWSETRKRLGLSQTAPASHLVAEHLETLAAHLGDKLTWRTNAPATALAA